MPPQQTQGWAPSAGMVLAKIIKGGSPTEGDVAECGKGQCREVRRTTLLSVLKYQRELHPPVQVFLRGVEISEWICKGMVTAFEYCNLFVAIHDSSSRSAIAIFVVPVYLFIFVFEDTVTQCTPAGLMDASLLCFFSLNSFHSWIRSRAAALNEAGNNATSIVGE